MVQKIVSTGFLLHEQRVLIIQRSHQETFLPGVFELPGGKVDFGEDPVVALQREFREEVGLDIIVQIPYHTFAYVSENSARHTVEILYLAHLRDGQDDQVRLSAAHGDFRWIMRDEVEQYALSPEIKASILLGFQIAT